VALGTGTTIEGCLVNRNKKTLGQLDAAREWKESQRLVLCFWYGHICEGMSVTDGGRECREGCV
jgi:hypothetical protein